MDVNLSNALSAYNRASKAPGAPADAAPKAEAGEGFASMLREAAESTIETLQASEAETLKAAAGKADINEVVMAVSQADITLQTVVAVRDRVIQAYQDVLRMPI